MNRASVLLLLLSACGLESLFHDYDPTPAPRVVLTFAAPDADRVEVRTADDELVMTVPAPAGEVDLGEERDWQGLRVIAWRGADVIGRALVADALRAPAPIELGALDETSSAAAILAEARLELDGLELAGAPAPITAELLRQARGDDPALATLRSLVSDAAGAGLLPVTGATVDLAGWDAALAAALGRIGVPIICDPAFVRVLFAVDLSGDALDGNGQRQLIRQPPKEGRVYLGFTVDDSSPVADAARQLPNRLTPNDPAYALGDDGAAGDEVAGDGIYSRALVLPRGMRLIYKYTDGSAGEPFTRTEEWPGNARILVVEDVVSRHGDGHPDCLVIRRDSFGDEASNKNFTSLAEKLRPAAGALGWDTDLGGPDAAPAGDRVVGGLDRLDPRSQPPLTPAGVPEARENGVCTRCPPPLVLAPGDEVAPRLLSAAFLSTTEIEVRFSEAMAFQAAQDPSAYLVVDAALRPLPVRAVAPAGDRVRLTVEGPDFGERYTLHVGALPDASAAANLLEGPDQVPVGRDVTAPRPLLGRAGSRKDVEASASLPDPTIGEVVFVTFSEPVERASAEDVSHYHLESIFGERLAVRGAFLRGPAQVALVTEPQARNRRYELTITGVTDYARNAVPLAEPLRFDGFALYRVRFGVVPGYAFASRDGLLRGIPSGEKMFLTGTPLAVARDLDATSLAVPGRTDVTGVPEMLMPATAELHGTKPVHVIELLLPPGTYAWKPAHGVSGEWVTPPATLLKVGKSLATTLDPSGVNVDPVTLTGRDGKSYAAAVLSAGGTEKPSTGVLFKRENPDEVCVVKDRDVDCGAVVIGTWRDLAEFTADYDDGQPEVAPTRTAPDREPPAPIWIQVRDSESLRLSFDEAIAPGIGVSGVEVVEVRAKYPGPHEIMVRTPPQVPGQRYQLAIAGLVDLAGNARSTPLVVTWTSPSTSVPFTPFEDTAPPILLGATPEGPTTLRVRFDEPLAPAAADPAKFVITARGAQPPPAVLAAALSGSGKDVILTTAPQPREGLFAVRAQNIADRATPANVLGSASVDFVGFGDSVPPVLVQARAIGPDLVALVFDEALDAESAADASRYQVAGATVTGVEFSGDAALRASMFDPQDAPLTRRLVVLHTSPLGGEREVTASVKDLSGNTGGGTALVTGVASPPKVTVMLEILVSDTATAWGSVPARALAPARLDAEREGIFVVGVGGFPAEGSPLTGVEPQAVDDGTGGDRVAGDRVYTLAVRDVPLGSQLEWKAFAPYTVAWKNSHPQDAAAAFADAPPGPSAFSDGQEYPGNENGVRVVADVDGDGVVRVRALFGDETTYKKLSRSPAFLWLAEEAAYAP